MKICQAIKIIEPHQNISRLVCNQLKNYCAYHGNVWRADILETWFSSEFYPNFQTILTHKLCLRGKYLQYSKCFKQCFFLLNFLSIYSFMENDMWKLWNAHIKLANWSEHFNVALRTRSLMFAQTVTKIYFWEDDW